MPDHGSIGPAQPLLLDIAEAARLLSLSDRTVWTLTDSGELPHVRIGRRVLYPLDRLRAWVAARIRGGTSVEPDAGAATGGALRVVQP
ncbi:MAG: helix-turn-helix domain-containing protein [Phycisphaerales bacterium]